MRVSTVGRSTCHEGGAKGKAVRVQGQQVVQAAAITLVVSALQHGATAHRHATSSQDKGRIFGRLTVWCLSVGGPKQTQALGADSAAQSLGRARWLLRLQ